MQIVSLGLILFAVVVIVLGIVEVHTYPGKVAKQRGHPQAEAIEVTSLLGLIAFPLWMAALIWAYGGVIGVPLEAVQGGAKGDSGADSAAAAAETESA